MPESSRLDFLDRQLERAQDQTLSDPGLPELDFSSPLPVVAAIPTLSELDSLLTVADIRLQNGQLITPGGDSALDYLRRAEAISFDDPVVTDTREGLGELLAVAARTLFDAGDVTAAEQRLSLARQLGASLEPLDELDDDISSLRAAVAADVEAERVASLLTNAQDRLQQDQLVSPEGDSAFFFLSTLRQDSPAYPGLDAAWQQLIDSLSSNAAAAIGAADWADGERWLVSLGSVDPESSLASELRASLTSSRLREEFLTQPAAPSELVLIEATPLVFPRNAQQTSIEGWVDLEFLVGLDGLVSEIIVVDAEPAGTFEQAAIDSVSTYRYQPFEYDGAVYARLLNLRVRFAIE
jgi:protein TonB